MHINRTKFVAFTRVDAKTGKAGVYVVERYAQDPVETQLIKTDRDAYTQGGAFLDK